jgi:hypothetical protein
MKRCSEGWKSGSSDRLSTCLTCEALEFKSQYHPKKRCCEIVIFNISGAIAEVSMIIPPFLSKSYSSIMRNNIF